MSTFDLADRERGPLNVGVVGIPGAWSTERLASALRQQGCRATVIDVASAVIDLAARSVRRSDHDLSRLDAIVVKKLGDASDPLTKERVAVLEALQDHGVRIFGRPASLARALDRVTMSLTLAAAEIPTPETLITESLDEAALVVERSGPVVVKPVMTSKGRGMMLLRPGDPIRIRLREFAREWGLPFYVQRYIPIDRDVGVAVLRDEVLGAYARVSSGASWLTTTEFGGHYERYTMNWGLAALAVRAARAFDLDFTVVDIAITPAGPLVLEVSAFGGFRGLWEAAGIDVAEAYAHHIVHELRGSRVGARSA